jgi:hypothetical protein
LVALVGVGRIQRPPGPSIYAQEADASEEHLGIGRLPGTEVIVNELAVVR